MNYVKINDKLYISLMKDTNGNSTAILRNSPANKGEKIKLQTNYSSDSILHSLRTDFNLLNLLNKKNFNIAMEESIKPEPQLSVNGVKQILNIQKEKEIIEKQIELNLTPIQKSRLSKVNISSEEIER